MLFRSEYMKQSRKRLAEWNSRGGTFIGRDYVDNYSFAGIMHPQTQILDEDLKFMKKNNFIGFYTEVGLNFSTNFLNYYVLSRLMWHSDADLNGIIDDFCRNAYGKGADKMKGFFTLMESSFCKCTTVGIHPGNIPDWYSPETIKKAYQILDEAKSLAETPKEKKRIDYARIGLEYTDKVVALFRIYRQLNDSGLPIGLVGYEPDFSRKYSTEEIVELLKAAKNAGAEVMAMLEKYQGTSLIQSYSFIRQNEVKRWFSTIEDYWQLYGQADSSRKTVKLSDTWKFQLDAKDIGVKSEWFKNDFDDSSWKDIKINATWEKQGYDNYDGYAWYRLSKVKIPEDSIKEECTLRLGAVDEDCWVYVNGALAGEHHFDEKLDPDGWKKPRNFVITKFLKAGADNTISIRVLDTKYDGGIWRGAVLIFGRSPSQEGKVIFLEDFEKNSTAAGMKKTHNAEWGISRDGAYEGKNSLYCKIITPFSDDVNWNVPPVQVEGDSTYMISLLFKSSRVKSNQNEKAEHRKYPKLPTIRVILLDADKKVCIPVKDYVWFGAGFKEKIENWEAIRKVVKTTSATRYLSMSMILNAQGEYWIDEITVEKL